MLFIDIETSSPNPEKPDWSLDPRRNKIDLIGSWHQKEFERDVAVLGLPEQLKGFKSFLEYCYLPYCGHNFKFDFKTLYYKYERAQELHDML